MPGLAGRMSTVIKAKVSRMLDRAEDPSETLDYGYQKQVELLQNVKKGIADVVTSKKRLQMQTQKLEQQVVKLDTQARQALSQGREDLARMALERKTLAQTELQTLDTQIKELESQQEQLTANELKLRQKIEQFRTKKEVIKAQYSAAEAQVAVDEEAHRDRRDMPAARDQAAEERLGPGGVVEVERLRIELGREALDPLGVERDLLERPEAKTDREVFEGAKSWPHRGTFRLTYKGA